MFFKAEHFSYTSALSLLSFTPFSIQSQNKTIFPWFFTFPGTVAVSSEFSERQSSLEDFI
jgi:hypothetical protein